MLLVGVDDTDSRHGGCTTTLAGEIPLLFPELTREREPRLVRLNPNVPWKTRGNGAVALAFAGDLPLAEALDRVRRHVERVARREEGTSPGVVVAPAAPDAALYDATVRRVVAREEALDAVARAGGLAWGGRGVIGAAAALAWPAGRATFERIAYRDDAPAPRRLEGARFRAVEERFPSLFDTYDLVEDDVVCVPSSPCPVLWGLRGETPADLARAAATLGPQRPVRETLFLTNQGTDDHLVDGTTRDARAFASLRVRLRVASPPVERGGHVFVEARDDEGPLRLAAYAPTRSFRRLALRLAPGDDLTACGGIHDGPDGRPTLGLEKLHLHETAPRRAGNPTCPGCARSMKSAGRAAGFRCRACGTREEGAPTRPGDIARGWHEVPSSARRHLAMPLKRLTAGAPRAPTPAATPARA